MLLITYSTGKFINKMVRSSLLFLYIFWRARVCWPLLCLCGQFCIFKRCLDFNPWRAAVASRRSTNLITHFRNSATHLPDLATNLPNLATHLLDFATHLPPPFSIREYTNKSTTIDVISAFQEYLKKWITSYTWGSI
jgi:hypothetical protein